MAKYSNHSLRLEFVADEYSPKIRFADDDKTASFNIVFSTMENGDNLAHICNAAIKAVAAFNAAFENELMQSQEDALVNEINF